MLSDSPLPRKRTHAPPWRGWRGLCAASWCARRDEPAAPQTWPARPRCWDRRAGRLATECQGRHHAGATSRAQRGADRRPEAIPSLARTATRTRSGSRSAGSLMASSTSDAGSSSTLATSSTRERIAARSRPWPAMTRSASLMGAAAVTAVLAIAGRAARPATRARRVWAMGSSLENSPTASIAAPAAQNEQRG